MASLYRAATSYEAFEEYVKLAEKRVNTPEQHEELASIKFWLEAKAAKLDAKLRASIAAGLNGVCSLFDDPKIREVFAPDPQLENFKGFDRLIEEGQIVALRVPKSQLKTVSTIVGTMTKLNFYDAVLNRLARAEHGSGDVGRGVFFVADEYDGYTTQPGDGDFFSKCREGKCCAVIATQTYESFVAKLRNEHVAAQLLANLRTKIWLCAEDNYTARQAADLCGEIERGKVSHSRNESAKLSAFSFIHGAVSAAGAVGLSASQSEWLGRVFGGADPVSAVPKSKATTRLQRQVRDFSAERYSADARTSFTKEGATNRRRVRMSSGVKGGRVVP